MFPAFQTVTVDKLALGKNFKLSQTQKSKVSNQYESCSEYDLCKMISEDFADTLYLVPPIPTRADLRMPFGQRGFKFDRFTFQRALLWRSVVAHYGG